MRTGSLYRLSHADLPRPRRQAALGGRPSQTSLTTLGTKPRRALEKESRRSPRAASVVIDLGENLSVTRRFSGSVPGLFSSSSVSRTAGAVAFTSQRVVATLSTQSDPAFIAIDCRWDAHQPQPMKVEISGDGVTLDVDVHRVDPSFQGHLSLQYNYDIAADVLARLPRTSLHQGVSAEFVCRAQGVRVPKAQWTVRFHTRLAAECV